VRCLVGFGVSKDGESQTVDMCGGAISGQGQSMDETALVF
jgi:hypothetical protein